MFCKFQETKDTVEHEERIEDINFEYPRTLILQISQNVILVEVFIETFIQ